MSVHTNATMQKPKNGVYTWHNYDILADTAAIKPISVDYFFPGLATKDSFVSNPRAHTNEQMPYVAAQLHQMLGTRKH